MHLISRRAFLTAATAGLASAALPWHSLLAQQVAGQRPNIIVILADDMGYGDVRCYNPQSKIPTPNMDRLATQGMRFTDAHTPSAVCTPTRYGLLTGRYCWRTRLKNMVLWTDYEEPLIEPGRPTVASMLKTTGYTTACIGKWHLGMNFTRPGGGFVRGKTAPQHGAGGTREVDFSQPIKGGPSELGFDAVWAIPAGHNLEPHFYVDGDRPAGNPTVWRGNAQPSKPGLSALESHEGWMTPDWDDQQVGPTLTGKALAFIEQSAKNKQPFFLYYAAQSPHRPCTPPDFAKGKSEAGVRGDMVWELDWTVGQITAKLDGLGIAGDTLIIVTSDNGAVKSSDEGKDFGHASCGPLRAFKSSIHEGGHRVPFIARWPGVIKPGSTNDSVICLTDLFATFAAITGTALPQTAAEDSFSILPALKGAALGDEDRPPVIHHSGGGQFAIRRGRWKLILDGKDKPAMLFDMRADPAETTNRLGDEPALAAQLVEKLADIRASGRTRGIR